MEDNIYEKNVGSKLASLACWLDFWPHLLMVTLSSYLFGLFGCIYSLKLGKRVAVVEETNEMFVVDIFTLALGGWIGIIDFNIILKVFKGFTPKRSQSEFKKCWIQIDLLWKWRRMYGELSWLVFAVANRCTTKIHLCQYV